MKGGTGAYNPSIKNFKYAINAIDEAPEQVLHVAQSLYHDIAPAKTLGMKTCHINRRHEQEGAGATPPVEGIVTDYVVDDLLGVCNLLWL